MIRTYIAGAIRKGKLADNIKRACDVGRAFAKLGYAIMVPHLSCFFDTIDNGLAYEAENSLNASEWLAIDLAWIEASDILIRINGESEGADAEVKHAEMLGIPVFYVNGVEDVAGVHDHIQKIFRQTLCYWQLRVEDVAGVHDHIQMLEKVVL